MYICLSADFRRCKALGNRLTPGVAYLKIAYGQTVDVRNIFPSALCGVHKYVFHYNLSPAVKVYRRHRRIRSSSGSQKTTDLYKWRFVCTRKLSKKSAKRHGRISLKHVHYVRVGHVVSWLSRPLGFTYCGSGCQCASYIMHFREPFVTHRLNLYLRLQLLPIPWSPYR